MKTFFVILSMCLMFISGIDAQKFPPKPGKVQKSDFEHPACPIDSAAEAYYLFDHGDVFFTYEINIGWCWIMRRQFRIKIQDTEGYKWADISLPYYEQGTEKEGIYSIKGFTYNKEGNKIVSTKLQKDNINKEDLSENLKQVKISMPNVKEGSVIELTYTLRSTFWTQLRDWDFQKDIPVLHSEFTIAIPEYFHYSINSRGYHPIQKNDIYITGGNIMISGNSLRFKNNCRHLVTKNLPALKDEKFVDNMENYRQGLEFELSYIQYPGEMAKKFSTSWEAVSEYLINHHAFGGKLKKTDIAKKDIAEITEKYADPSERMIAVYDHVKSKLKSNGKYDFYSTDFLRKVYSDGVGCSKDINFILINLLREANIQAYPVTVSTRGNGTILPTFPTIDKFNYVLALAVIDGKGIFLDASNPYCSPGVVPSFCLNGKGRIIDKELNKWVEIPANLPYTETNSYNLSLNDDGSMEGKIINIKEGYAAMNFRKQEKDYLNEDEIIEDIQSENTGLLVKDYRFEGLDEVQAKITSELDVVITGGYDNLGDMISFSPMLYEAFKENPFKLEERKFPVDFNFPLKYVNVFSYNIPENYKVESIPENVSFITPDKTAKFTYSVKQFGNMINVTTLMEINKVMYLPSEYDLIKEFFRMMVAKEAEQIIIKKI